MRFRVLCLLSVALPCGADSCFAIKQHETGSITVHAIDITDAPMDYFQSQLLYPRTREHVMSFREDAAGVPYGIYLLTVESQGFRTSEQLVYVFQAETVVRAQLTFAWPCASPPHLGGSIRPVSTDRDLWVKLIPLRGSGGRETKAPYGFFGFANVDAGQHLLIVMEGESVRHIRVLTVKADTQIRIDLDSVTP